MYSLTAPHPNAIRGRRSVRDREESPASGHTFQLILALILELEAGSRHEHWDSGRDQHLAR